METRTTSVAKYVPKSAITEVKCRSSSLSKSKSTIKTVEDDIDPVFDKTAPEVEDMDLGRPRRRLRGGQLEPWPPAPKFRDSLCDGVFFFRRFEFSSRLNKLVGLLPAERAVLETVGPYFVTHDLLRKWVLPLNEELPGMPALRTMDWAVTNYFKGHTITIRDPRSPDGRLLDPHMAYNSSLDFWHRLLFDPFRRGTHVWFEHEGQFYYTTAGQLNFLKWLKDTKIDELITEHEKDIILHRNQGFKASRRRSKLAKQLKLPRRRSELTPVTKMAAKAFVKRSRCDDPDAPI
jgi:hypothetical protein